MTLRRDEGTLPRIEVSNVRFVPADASQVRTGLVGFVSFVLNRDLSIEAKVCRTKSGVHTLSYPAHSDQFGLKHFAVHPVHDRARLEIEKQVFALLELEERPVPPPSPPASGTSAAQPGVLEKEASTQARRLR